MLGIGCPTMCIFLMLTASAALLRRDHSHELPPASIEEVIVREQMRRSTTLLDTDILITGDSSALMDVDAVALSSELGSKRVESLATLGWVGPAGHARLVERYANAGHEVKTLVILLNDATLAFDEQAFTAHDCESLVLSGSESNDHSVILSARSTIYATTIAPLVGVPLPGLYGARYGFPEDLAFRLRQWHGTLIDPNQYETNFCLYGEYRYVLSSAAERRLATMRETLSRVGPKAVWFALAPIPQDQVAGATEGSRSTVLARTIEALGLEPRQVIPVPSALPADAFATATHLNEKGRAQYTRALSDALRLP